MVNIATKPFSLPEAMQDYLVARNSPPSSHHRSLIDVAAAMDQGTMRLGTEAGTFLTLLTHAVQPRFALEIGTFIGYSSLSIASALPPEARLLCCDVSREWTEIARQHWERSGVADRIDLVIGPAIDTVNALDEAATIDLAFIDADKSSYIDYYEAIVPRLSANGIMAVDNTMWSARVLDQDDTSVDTVAIRAFNDHVAADDRTTNVTLPLGDGITLITHAVGLS